MKDEIKPEDCIETEKEARALAREIAKREYEKDKRNSFKYIQEGILEIKTIANIIKITPEYRKTLEKKIKGIETFTNEISNSKSKRERAEKEKKLLKEVISLEHLENRIQIAEKGKGALLEKIENVKFFAERNAEKMKDSYTYKREYEHQLFNWGETYSKIMPKTKIQHFFTNLKYLTKPQKEIVLRMLACKKREKISFDDRGDFLSDKIHKYYNNHFWKLKEKLGFVYKHHHFEDLIPSGKLIKSHKRQYGIDYETYIEGLKLSKNSERKLRKKEHKLFGNEYYNYFKNEYEKEGATPEKLTSLLGDIKEEKSKIPKFLSTNSCIDLLISNRDLSESQYTRLMKLISFAYSLYRNERMHRK